MRIETLTIGRRFRGPSQSGNGGYVCGRVARHIPGSATVRLRRPPPLETGLHIDRAEDLVTLRHGSEMIAEGWPDELTLVPPAAPTLKEARGAMRNFLGFQRHAFPQCFVCGTAREEGDGYRLFTGRLPDADVVAAPWIVDGSLAERGRIGAEFLWAALDCPSSFAVAPAPPGRTLVLGQLSARIESGVEAGETYVVIGWPIRIDGRKRFAGSAVFDQAGRRVALGSAIWIDVPESAFPPEAAD